MTLEEVTKQIEENHLDIKKFWKWMEGKTVGINSDGSDDYYDYDVKRYINSKLKIAQRILIEGIKNDITNT